MKIWNQNEPNFPRHKCTSSLLWDCFKLSLAQTIVHECNRWVLLTQLSGHFGVWNKGRSHNDWPIFCQRVTQMSHLYFMEYKVSRIGHGISKAHFRLQEFQSCRFCLNYQTHCFVNQASFKQISLFTLCNWKRRSFTPGSDSNRA